MPRSDVEEALLGADRLRRQIESLDLGTGAAPKRSFLHDDESAEVIRRIGDYGGPITFVVGAGASIEANLPAWRTLVRRVLENVRLGKSVNRDEWESTLFEGGPMAAAALAQAQLSNFPRRVSEALYQGNRPQDFRPGALAEQIAHWREQFGKDVTIVTVNYDDLLEKALAQQGLQPCPVGRAGEEAKSDEAPVFHLHGRLDHTDSDGPIVLSEDDYARFSTDGTWQDRLMSELLGETMCVFVGLSFSDPNLLRWVHTAVNGAPDRHVALFSRQSSPRLSEEVRKKLEEMTRHRWAAANIDAFFTDFFGEQAQILHEAALMRHDSHLDPFEERAQRSYESARSFFGLDADFVAAQEGASAWLSEVAESVRTMVRSQKARFHGEQIGLGVWVANHAEGTMLLLGLSDRAYTDQRSLVSVPLELVSNWTSVETLTNGSARDQDPDVYASRWRYVRGLPLVVDKGEHGRTLVGAITLTSTKPRAKSVFSRTPNAVLDEIDEVLGDAGVLAFTA